jgi:hypothetical protein
LIDVDVVVVLCGMVAFVVVVIGVVVVWIGVVGTVVVVMGVVVVVVGCCKLITFARYLFKLRSDIPAQQHQFMLLPLAILQYQVPYIT